ncbi:hypothetical protein PR048_011025 [Dryococelus australis]|uniref:Uncharacterized protein n=1 Tax=Dryococelus australis TaxID=614101 RepID=A0ABQ9HKZ5_9NEOP|nr:hypothetical protein PR048_011025 [Dryococelus australis]
MSNEVAKVPRGETVGYDRKLSYFDFVPDNHCALEFSELLDLSHLKGAPKEKLFLALKVFSDVFLRKDQKLGCTNRISHSDRGCETALRPTI